MAKLHRFEYKQVHMGVQARIVLFAPEAEAARAAAEAAFDRIAELDEVMSDYRVDSELMELSRTQDARSVPVSADLFAVLSLAQHLAALSGGAFDVTVGPYVALWRRARNDGRLPSAAELETAERRTGWTKLELDAERRTVTLAADSMQLDLGGIAKGFAADAAIDILHEHGMQRALIEFGGDVAVADPPPGEAGWRISAALLPPGASELILDNEAVSTSGDTQQYVDIDGTRYSHVVDPRTGFGLTNRTTATVIAPTAALSDALSTVLTVMGPEDGLEMIDRHFPEVKAYVRRAVPE